MADIILEALKFTGPYSKFSGTFRIPITLRDYLRASLTVGFQNGLESRNAGQHTRWDRFLNGRRAYNWLTEESSDLCLAPDFKTLDASEQRPLS
jgi:hypothetical protein